MPNRLLWGECTWEEIAEAANAQALAVVPFGSTEQHGPMLPLDTDTHIAERVAISGARYAAENFGIRALVLPTMPFGMALHHLRFAGTISFQAETYLRVITDVLSCVVKHGCRRIAVISGHGGNRPALELAIAQVVAGLQDTFTLRIALFQGHQDPEFRKLSQQIHEGEPSEGQPGIHAARWETSETLADRPDLVRQGRLARPALERETVPQWRWLTHELSETGAFGDPAMARADLGQKMWDAWAEAVGLFLRRLAAEPLP